VPAEIESDVIGVFWGLLEYLLFGYGIHISATTVFIYG
jgi:hypothetical protein